MALKRFGSPNPRCPVCGEPTRIQGGIKGDRWECMDYPDCQGVIQLGLPRPQGIDHSKLTSLLCATLTGLLAKQNSGLVSQNDFARAAVLLAVETYRELHKYLEEQTNADQKHIQPASREVHAEAGTARAEEAPRHGDQRPPGAAC